MMAHSNKDHHEAYRSSRDKPYLIGKGDGTAGTINCNPFELFSDKWVMYNRGYNSIRNPWMTTSSVKYKSQNCVN